jgi:hypothetical protein
MSANQGIVEGGRRSTEIRVANDWLLPSEEDYHYVTWLVREAVVEAKDEC